MFLSYKLNIFKFVHICTYTMSYCKCMHYAILVGRTKINYNYASSVHGSYFQVPIFRVWFVIVILLDIA